MADMWRAKQMEQRCVLAEIYKQIENSFCTQLLPTISFIPTLPLGRWIFGTKIESDSKCRAPQSLCVEPANSLSMLHVLSVLCVLDWLCEQQRLPVKYIPSSFYTFCFSLLSFRCRFCGHRHPNGQHVYCTLQQRSNQP